MARKAARFQGESRFNQASGRAASIADRAVRQAQEGSQPPRSYRIHRQASRRPFNRYLANALKNLGASSTITLDSQGGWRFSNTSRAQKYAAATTRAPIRWRFPLPARPSGILHELVHAATMKAIKAGWPAACGCGRCSSMCRSLAR